MLPAHYRKEENTYFCRFTFGQFFTLLVLEIFTLFFVFYLGARYGGELFGIAAPPAAPPQAEGMPTVTTTDPDQVATTQDPEIRALAKDILQAAPASDLKERVAEMLKQSGEEQEEKQAPREPRTAASPPSIKKPAQPVAAATPPVIQTAPSDARFTIQVGAYQNADEAHQIVGRWKAKGYPAYLTSADLPGKGRWYRVRLGGFATQEDAQVYLDQFRQKEGVEAFIATNF